MASLILDNKDMFRAERLFSERVSSPISTNSFYRTRSERNEDNNETIVFNKFISRLLNDTKKYRVVQL